MRDDKAAKQFNSVNEWLAWQETLHAQEIDLGLTRVEQVYQQLALSWPSPRYVITVAGTNGKGSCVAYLSSMFRHLGYRVGSYTSPHLLLYNERIQVDGQVIDDADLMRAFARVEQARDGVSLTYFEFGTLAALSHFAATQCSVLVLEVGLGGRLDAVNIIDPDVAVITSIGLDHMDWLGDTREQIALEKAGILRGQKPFVCGEPDPPPGLLEYAAALGAQSYLIGRDFRFTEFEQHWHWQQGNFSLSELPYPAMRGRFQLGNFSAALMCLALLRGDSLQDPYWLTTVLSTVRVAGRVQVLRQDPLGMVDVAHNPQAALALAQVLAEAKKSDTTRIFAVFSMLTRKDVKGVIAALAPVIDNWMLAPMRDHECYSSDHLDALIREHYAQIHRPLQSMRCVDLKSAWQQALIEAKHNDIVIAFGSFYTVAEILNACNN